MLTAGQIIPFLSHEDPEVRSHARRYLVSAHDPSPATAEDFWAAADKAPPDEVGAYIDRLGFVPQTEASFRRLLDELPKADPASQDSLRRTLERLDFSLLQEHWELIQANPAVSQALRDHFQARIDLANEPPEPLWDRMTEFAVALGERDITEAEELQADRLMEAVSRHDALFAPRVLADLSDPAVKAWHELFVVDLAGEMRLTNGVGLLLDKLNVDDSDFLWEVAADALVRIGDDNVINAITDRFAKDGEGFRISATEILGRIKRPESQAALTKLLPVETDLAIVAAIAGSLVDLCPTDAPTLDTLRALARDVAYDRMTTHLDESLLTLSTMTGIDLPEGPEWQKRIDESRSRWSVGMSNVDHLMQPVGSLGPSTLHAAPLTPTRPDRSAAAVAERPAQVRKPFRNERAKVGRNDPCPCGSGKKLKKCCGK